MGTPTTSCSSFLFLGISLRALALVVFIFLLVSGTLWDGEGTRRIASLSTWSSSSTHEGRLNHGGYMIGREKINRSKLERINYMSKRRVPNGPDPIHNRRAGNSGRPPGQA